MTITPDRKRMFRVTTENDEFTACLTDTGARDIARNGCRVQSFKDQSTDNPFVVR